VIWGIKNVLHAFIREEECNITQKILSSSEQGIARGLTILFSQYPAKNGNYALAAAISSIYL